MSNGNGHDSAPRPACPLVKGTCTEGKCIFYGSLTKHAPGAIVGSVQTQQIGGCVFILNLMLLSDVVRAVQSQSALPVNFPFKTPLP